MVKSYLPKNVVFSSYMHMYNAACVFHYIKVFFLFSQFKVLLCFGCQGEESSHTLKSFYCGTCLHCSCRLNFWDCFNFLVVCIFEVIFIFEVVFTFDMVFIFWVIFIYGLVFLVKVIFIFKTVFFLVIFTFEMSAYWFVLTMLTHGWVNKSGKTDKVLEGTPTYWSAWSMWESNHPNHMNPNVWNENEKQSIFQVYHLPVCETCPSTREKQAQLGVPHSKTQVELDW